MLRFVAAALASAPALALAAFYPNVTKGPVISGVTQTEAWVAWATAHHEGTGTQCSAEAFTGSPNTDVPTLTLSPTSTDGSRFRDATCSRIHRVHLTGLAPDTRYSFTLDKGYPNEPDASGTFRTAPAGQDERFSFVVYGDNRDAPVTSSSTRPDHQAVSDGIVVRETDADFLVHTGDLALNIPGVSGDDNGYTEFFDVERGLLSSRPIFAVIGNHETLDTQEFDDLVNAPSFAGSPHPYFGSVDWGRAHLVFVDSFEGAPQIGGLGGRAGGVSPEQATWLEQDLAAAQLAGQHIFVITHQGAFSHGDSSAHGGSPAVRDQVLPIMLRHQALGIFAGHDHYYERGHEGCVDYFVVGGGGAPMYEPDPAAPGVAVAQKKTSYLVVTVDGAHVTAIAKSSGGQILDTFTFQPADGTACGVPPVVVDDGTPDAGTPVDAGVPDAGHVVIEHPDAGHVIVDAGSDDAPDAGPVVLPHRDPPTAAAEGCNCAGAGGAAMAAWSLLALVLRRRAKA